MANQFISPNWHVVFIHYPLALIVLGVLIEIVTFARPRGGFRAAGRWMMLAGAMLAIPTATSGIYAFRDVVTPSAVSVATPWYEVVQQSNWMPGQWDLMVRHIWLNGIAVALAAVAVILWLGGSDPWRRRIYWPVLLVMIVVAGLISAGAWHGGELVYRYGTGVEPPGTAGQAADLLATGAAAQPTGNHNITYYLPPLQLHMVLVGFAVMLAVAGFALMLRRWYLDRLTGQVHPTEGRPITPAVTPEGMPVTRQERAELHALEPSGAEQFPADQPTRVSPGWYWLGAALVAIAAATAGAWSYLGAFTQDSLQKNWQTLQADWLSRLSLHVVFGASIIVLSLLLAILVRFARRARGINGTLATVVLLLIVGQVWLGVLMTYDGRQGPLTSFVYPDEAVMSEETTPQTQPDQPAGTALPAHRPAEAAPEPAPARQTPAPAVATQEVLPEVAQPSPRAVEPAMQPAAPASPTVEPGAPSGTMVQERSPAADEPRESTAQPEEITAGPRTEPQASPDQPLEGGRHEEVTTPQPGE